MLFKITKRNPRHTTVNVFIDGACNGTLRMTTYEWRHLQELIPGCVVEDCRPPTREERIAKLTTDVERMVQELRNDGVDITF